MIPYYIYCTLIISSSQVFFEYLKSFFTIYTKFNIHLSYTKLSITHNNNFDLKYPLLEDQAGDILIRF